MFLSAQLSLANPAVNSLETICNTCEALYARDGYVKWSDVGAALGVSRQAIQLRLRAATERGDLSPETVERWQSMTSRSAVTRERTKAQEEREAAALARKRERERNTLKVLLTPENMAWVRREAVLRKVHTPDLINGLITRARSESGDV